MGKAEEKGKNEDKGKETIVPTSIECVLSGEVWRGGHKRIYGTKKARPRTGIEWKKFTSSQGRMSESNWGIC